MGRGDDDRGRLHAVRPPRDPVYLGTLARRTLISTNVAEVLKAANRKPIIFMPARHDHQRVQTGDGYAYVAGAHVGAPIGMTTDAQASWWGGRGLGTVPHALISAYGGNTVLAATKFAGGREDFNYVVLVDFENDSVRTALGWRAPLARASGVRLDTSGQLVDRSLWNEMGDFGPRRQRAARPQGARCARPRRVRAGEDRRVGRLHRREDQALRRGGRPRPSTPTASARR